MTWQLTVGKKITGLAAILVAFLLVTGGVAFVTSARISRDLHEITSDAMPGLQHVGAVSYKLYLFRGDAWKHVATAETGAMQTIENQMASVRKETEDEMAEYEKAITMEEDRANFAQLRTLEERMFQAWDKVAPESRKGRSEGAYQSYLTQVEPAFQDLHRLLTEMQDWNEKYGDKLAEEAVGNASLARTVTLALLVGSMIVAVFVSVFIIGGINRTLREAVAELSQGASQVASAAGQVAAAGQSLAHGASEQAASLEETSAACEEINAMVRKNSESSVAAAGLASQSHQRFADTNDSLDLMVTAMSEINAQSGKISKIIKV
ncbi:MAG: MCP four helix bundle domain-containing protein, partial [Acidobacteriota bacterium]